MICVSRARRARPVQGTGRLPPTDARPQAPQTMSGDAPDTPGAPRDRFGLPKVTDFWDRAQIASALVANAQDFDDEKQLVSHVESKRDRRGSTGQRQDKIKNVVKNLKHCK